MCTLTDVIKGGFIVVLLSKSEIFFLQLKEVVGQSYIIILIIELKCL